MKTGSFIAAAAFAITAGAANAASITYTAPPDGLSISGAAFGIVSLPQFNPGSGAIPLDATLTSVTVGFSGEFDSILTAIVLDPTANGGVGAVSGEAGWAEAAVSGTDANGISFGGPQTFFGGDPFSATLPADFNYNIAAEDFVAPFNAFAETANGMIVLGDYNIAAADFGLYLGAGAVFWQFSANFGDLSDTTNVFRGTEGVIDLAGTVEYTYRVPTGDVPVPAALPLLATALGGFGFMSWRKKRAA